MTGSHYPYIDSPLMSPGLRGGGAVVWNDWSVKYTRAGDPAAWIDFFAASARSTDKCATSSRVRLCWSWSAFMASACSRFNCDVGATLSANNARSHQANNKCEGLNSMHYTICSCVLVISIKSMHSVSVKITGPQTTAHHKHYALVKCNILHLFPCCVLDATQTFLLRAAVADLHMYWWLFEANSLQKFK